MGSTGLISAFERPALRFRAHVLAIPIYSEREILHHALARMIDVPFDFIDGKTESRKSVPYIVFMQRAIRVSVNDQLVP